MQANSWFAVDKDGLAKLLAGRGKGFVIGELIQNAWDEDATNVDVKLEPAPLLSEGWFQLTVEDDDPDGFTDLTHAYTLYAESEKKDDPGKRGRFNLGEKMVLALCEFAVIDTTTGRVEFEPDGTRTEYPAGRKRGSAFIGHLRLTEDEAKEMGAYVKRLIPPAGIITTFNGDLLAERTPERTFTAKLATVQSDEHGVLRSTHRKTAIEVYDFGEDETGWLYEMGLPVVETGDRWSVNIMQKVPLNADRDNVTVSFLRDMRVAVAEGMQDALGEVDSGSTFLNEVLASKYTSAETINAVMNVKFGPKRVSFDPSDPEANNLAVARGYMVVHPRTLSKEQWQQVRRAEAIKPAGQVTPSNARLETSAEGEPPIPESEWTPAMHDVASFARKLHDNVYGAGLSVTMHSHQGIERNWSAAYSIGHLMFNVRALGRPWFERQAASAREAGWFSAKDLIELLIHEFAHYQASNHLDESYHRALCNVGWRMITTLDKYPAFGEYAWAEEVRV